MSLNSVHRSGEGGREERGGAGVDGMEREVRAAVGQGRDKRGRGEGLVEYIVPLLSVSMNCFSFEWVYRYIVVGVGLSELSLMGRV